MAIFKRRSGAGTVTVTEIPSSPPAAPVDPEPTAAQIEGTRVQALLAAQAIERRQAALRSAYVSEERARREREEIKRELAAEEVRREREWLRQYRAQMAREAASPDRFSAADFD